MEKDFKTTCINCGYAEMMHRNLNNACPIKPQYHNRRYYMFSENSYFKKFDDLISKPFAQTLIYYDYFELMNYIEKKYKLNTDPLYDWLYSWFDGGLYNGCYKTFQIDGWLDAAFLNGFKQYYPDYIVEILNIIQSEGFLNERGEINVHVWW